MKTVFIIMLFAIFATGCATSESIKTVKLTEEQCSAQGGMVLEYNDRLSCLSGSKPQLIASK